MRAALVLLAACNQIYDLSPTVARDARYFDAPSDAPYSCPPPGTPLQFSSKLSQLLLPCISYTESATKQLALASCRHPGIAFPQISVGPIGGPFTQLTAVPMSTDALDVSLPQLAADGDLFLLHTFDLVSTQSTIRVYRDAGGTWVRAADFPVALTTTTNPSRAPDRRVLFQTNVTADVREVREDAAGTWSELPAHPLAAIGVQSLRIAWLAPDALRVLYTVNPERPIEVQYLAYSERAAPTDRFGPAIPTSLPVVFDPFITEDCSRIYFSGLQSLFYATRQ